MPSLDYAPFPAPLAPRLAATAPAPDMDLDRRNELARAVATVESGLRDPTAFLPTSRAEAMVEWLLADAPGATLSMRAEPGQIDLTAWGVSATGGPYGGYYAVLCNWLSAAKRRLAETRGAR